MKSRFFGIALWKHLLVGSFVLTIVLVWIFWPHEIKHRPANKIKYSVKFLNASKKVAQREVSKLSIEDKIAQLIMVKADSTLDSAKVKRWVTQLHIGGIVFQNMLPSELKRWSDYSQSLSNKPLLIAHDGPFKNALPEVQKITLASINNDSLVNLHYSKVLADNKSAGINLMFPPNLSLDTLPDSTDGYSEFFDKNSALKKLQDYVANGEEVHVLTGTPEFQQEFAFDTAKKVGPIKALFSSLFKHGLPCMKVNLEEFDERTDVPAELKELGFEGLLFAEGDFRTPGDNFDVLFAGSDPIKLIARIKNEVAQSSTLQKNIEQSTVKVLQAKKWLFPRKFKPQIDKGLDERITGNEASANHRRLIENGFVVIKNEESALPINRIYNNSLLILTLGDPVEWAFTNRCRSYHPAWGQELNPKNLPSLPKLDVKKLKNHNPLVITINDLALDTNRDADFLSSLEALSKETKVIVAHLGSTKNLPMLNKATALIHSNETDKTAMDLMAQLIFGGATTSGKMPIHVEDSITVGTGLPLDKKIRLKYTLPEEVGIQTDSMNKIDAIVREAQRFRATPGCQVVIAYKGSVIFDKSYGYHTYKRRTRVRNSDMYDLSSVTKVFSTTLAIMKLYDDKKIKLNHNLKKYFKRELDTLSGCKVKNVKIEELLTHKSGLQSYMPIVTYLQNKDSLFNKFDQYFCDQKSHWFRQEIGEKWYLRKDVPDSIWMDMKKIHVRNDRKYIYSDLNFNLLQKVVEKITNRGLDTYVRKNFYIPLGLQRTTYNPTERFDKKHIVPTEDDKKWRKMLVDGYVHDQSAALLGGVAGNAGLFSNAHDLAVMGQMLLNKGTYGGKRFFKSSTVEKFTQKAENTHRGLGFNKPVPDKMKFIAASADHNSYGHTGFAGTCVWIDPKNEIVFVFLSNRIHPKINNWKLNTYRVRSRIHQVIYDCLGISNEEEEAEESIEELQADTLNVPEELMSDE